LKSRALVEDQWVYAAPGVVPGILAHGFSITDQGRRELRLLQSIPDECKPYPLGYRILLFMSHGNVMTTGQIAKMVDKDRGEVKRTMKSLQNKGLVDYLYSKTRTSFSHDMITHLWRISQLGRRVLDAGVERYFRIIRSRTRRS